MEKRTSGLCETGATLAKAELNERSVAFSGVGPGCRAVHFELPQGANHLREISPVLPDVYACILPFLLSQQRLPLVRPLARASLSVTF